MKGAKPMKCNLQMNLGNKPMKCNLLSLFFMSDIIVKLLQMNLGTGIRNETGKNNNAAEDTI